MAENESLDVSNRRFRWVVADLLRGAPVEEIAYRVVAKLCAVWNHVRKHGMDVLEVVGLAAAGNDLTAAIRDTGGSDLAHLIRLQAGPMRMAGPILDGVNRAALEQVVQSGVLQAIYHENGPSLVDAMRLKSQILAAAEPAISRLTDSLLGGPGKRLRAPKIPTLAATLPAVSIRMPAALMAQSLLPPAQRIAAQGASS